MDGHKILPPIRTHRAYCAECQSWGEHYTYDHFEVIWPARNTQPIRRKEVVGDS